MNQLQSFCDSQRSGTRSEMAEERVERGRQTTQLVWTDFPVSGAVDNSETFGVKGSLHVVDARACFMCS